MNILEFILSSLLGIFLLCLFNQYSNKIRCHSLKETYYIESKLKTYLHYKSRNIGFYACKTNKTQFKLPSKIDFK
jgi:hypothetical protein